MQARDVQHFPQGGLYPSSGEAAFRVPTYLVPMRTDTHCDGCGATIRRGLVAHVGTFTTCLTCGPHLEAGR